MAKSTKEKKPAKASPTRRLERIPWGWVILGAVLLVVAYFAWNAQTAPRFILKEGKKDLLVLIRDEEEGIYRLKYEGRKPVKLQALQVMLAGQVLHVDLKQVALVRADQRVILEQPKGTLPSGVEFSLNPGDEFEVRILFHGQSIGGNYLYGFRLDYLQANRSDTYDLVLEYEYSVVVK